MRKAIAAGVVAECYRPPAFSFTNPYALVGAHDVVAVPRARSGSTSSSRSPWWSGGTASRWPRSRPDQAVNSPERELRVFTSEEGATEHTGLDHLPYPSTYIADWVTDTFAELA